jgi:hypothetical protein
MCVTPNRYKNVFSNSNTHRNCSLLFTIKMGVGGRPPVLVWLVWLRISGGQCGFENA